MGRGQADLTGRDAGPDFGDTRLDHFMPELTRHRNPVMSVLDEVDRSNPVGVDRREMLAPARRPGDPLPAAADSLRGRPELAVETMTAVNRADYRVDRDRP